MKWCSTPRAMGILRSVTQREERPNDPAWLATQAIMKIQHSAFTFSQVR